MVRASCSARYCTTRLRSADAVDRVEAQLVDEAKYRALTVYRIRQKTSRDVAAQPWRATGGDRLLTPIGDPRSRIRSASPDLLRDVLAHELSEQRSLKAAALYDPRHPRLKTPSPRPVRCHDL